MAASLVALGAAASRLVSGRPSGAGAQERASVRRDALVRAVAIVGPAVANISTERVVVYRSRFFGGSDFDEYFREFFGEPPARRFRQTSLGSGVVIDPAGYVVTNAHVVARATAIRVTLPPAPGSAEGARPRTASLVNFSPENDLALVKIEEPGPFPAARLARPDDVLIGETVIALGNPFGLESSVTHGVLSAKDRSLAEGGGSKYSDFLQTDAAINPGNSGGPLANLAGEVIGLNTAIVAQAHGIGFAIPVRRVRAVLAELADERELYGKWTGLLLDPQAPAEGGARVASVAPGSPAEKAGLRAGDVVIEAGGDPVGWAFDVKRRLLEAAPEEAPVPLTVRRGDRRLTLALACAAAPATPSEQRVRERLGLRAKPISPVLAERAGLREAAGALVARTEEGGPGEEAGLQAGDIVTRVGVPLASSRGFRRYELYEIRSVEDLGAVLAHLGKGVALMVFVVRDGQEFRAEVVIR